jgi:nucleoside phosphorylase
MGENLTAPGLVTHVFLDAGNQQMAAGWNRLRSLWRTVTDHFGLDRPSRLAGVPAVFPPEPPGGVGLLAAAERDKASVWQAAAWADHGILCLTTMMAPPPGDGCGRAWIGLERDWRDAVSSFPPTEILGEARLFLALAPSGQGLAPSGQDGDLPPDEAPQRRAVELVRAAAPQPSATGWWQHWDAVPLGASGRGPGEALVWEIGPESGDGRITRRLAAVAPAEYERQADHLLWTTGDGTPAPLTRHLMHAARLRHQIRVFDDGELPRHLRDDLALLVDDLSDGATDEPRPGQPRVQFHDTPTRAVALRARLAAIRQAAGIVGENMVRAVNLPHGDAAVGPLSEDRQLATWFGQRLDDEIARLDAAGKSAQDAISTSGRSAPATARPANGGQKASRSPGSRGAQARREAPSQAPCVVIFTALEVEYKAVRAYLADPAEQRQERGTLYEVGEIHEVRGSWRVAIAQAGQGRTSAGVQLERAISVFAPDVALFLGVAGGRKDVALGDVVVANTVYDYESGKSTRTGYQPRMRTHSSSFRLLQRAQLVVRENQWQQRILPSCPHRPPAAFIKPIVTGGKVVADPTSATAQLLDQYASDALAVEMEGHGFLEGAYLNPGVDALVIRGISDLLSGKTKASDELWQPIAQYH